MQLKTQSKLKGPHIAKVLNNTRLSDDTWKLTFKNTLIAENAKPGQFISILCHDLLLRRPFSVAFTKDDTFDIIYKVKGQGTEYLTTLTNGDSADIIGPLGNGFNIENRKSLLIGCGVGIAPVNFLASALENSGIKYAFVACSQTFMDLDYSYSIPNLGVNNPDKIIIITEDGSAGLAGRLDQHLENIIIKTKPKKFIPADRILRWLISAQ